MAILPKLNDQVKRLSRGAAVDVVAGVDVGSVTSKAVIIADGDILSYSNIRTSYNSRDSAIKAIGDCLADTGIKMQDLSYIVGTGYGRANVPFANRIITEITCHARGAHFVCGPAIHTILDMGGQDCKVIKCSDKGEVINFVLNDKCAAGTGRAFEVIAKLLGLGIDHIGPLSFDYEGQVPIISNKCVIFAKTEGMALIRQGVGVNKVLAAFCDAISRRVVSLIRSVGIEKELVITGGIAKNIGICRRIEKQLNLQVFPLKGVDPQIVGALGAALFAHDALAI